MEVKEHQNYNMRLVFTKIKNKVLGWWSHILVTSLASQILHIQYACFLT